ncbi:MAG: tetratricopeptide repeat protein [Chloroflexia bacterium]|nr:tetratricopeptide repeat protein [Chloroflexia bacterium]
MTREEPLKFRIGRTDFDSELLPPDSRETDTHAFEQAVTAFYRNQFAPLDGEVDVSFSDDTIEVSWEPDRPTETLMERAISLLQTGELVKAVPFLEALIAVEPDNVDALYNLGMAFSDLGRLDEAKMYLLKAIHIQPDHSNALTALGVALQRSGDPEAARRRLEQAVKIDQSNGYAYRNLGAVLGTLGEWNEAEPAFRKACQLLPEDQPSVFGLAEVLAKSGNTDRLDEADKAYERAIRIDPDSQISEMARQARSRIAQSNFRQAGGALRPDGVMYCLGALEKFEHMSQSEVQAVAFEIAMLGRRGIEVNDPDVTYALRSLPGSYTGLHLMALMYVGFKQIAPDLDSGFDLKAEYKTAQQLHSAGPRDQE